MAKKAGRKTLPKSRKKKLMAAYVDDTERRAILKKYASLTSAIRIEVLPKCN